MVALNSELICNDLGYIRCDKKGGIIIKNSLAGRIFAVFNYTFMIGLILLYILPLLRLLALSFSAPEAVVKNLVTFWPVDFTLDAYVYVLQQKTFLKSVLLSGYRILLAVPLEILLAILMAYPLSKTESFFKARKYYVRFLLFGMAFGVWLIPAFLTVKYTGLRDTIWALVLPTAVNVSYIIILQNFFKKLPQEIEESARLDGASDWRILWSIIVPLSKTVITTLVLFVFIYHWNDWFSGIIYMSQPENYPLQSYVSIITRPVWSFVVQPTEEQMIYLYNVVKPLNSTYMLLSLLPVFCIYFLIRKNLTEKIYITEMREKDV